jgi:hypothetical protein
MSESLCARVRYLGLTSAQSAVRQEAEHNATARNILESPDPLRLIDAIDGPSGSLCNPRTWLQYVRTMREWGAVSTYAARMHPEYVARVYLATPASVAATMFTMYPGANASHMLTGAGIGLLWGAMFATIKHEENRTNARLEFRDLVRKVNQTGYDYSRDHYGGVLTTY